MSDNALCRLTPSILLTLTFIANFIIFNLTRLLQYNIALLLQSIYNLYNMIMLISYNTMKSYDIFSSHTYIAQHLTNYLPFYSNHVLLSGDIVLRNLNDSWCYLLVDHSMVRCFTLYSFNIAYNIGLSKCDHYFDNTS